MFDARSILDAMVRGAGQSPGARSGQGSEAFRDLLGQLGTQPGVERAETPAAQGRVPPASQQAPDSYQPGPSDDGPPTGTGGPSLEDLLRSVLGGGEPTAPDPRTGDPRTGQGGHGGGDLQDILRDLLRGGPAAQDQGAEQRGGGGGSLQDILRELIAGPGGTMNRMVGDGGKPAGAGGANVLDALRQVLGQATSGIREGAGRLDETTGASARARDAIAQATGQSPEELMGRLKELIANNQLGAGAALGGLGALILGTNAGRSLAGSAVKLGGLALIGGLAYKAYQNYQQGLPPLSGGKAPTQQSLVAAPNGSGFEPGAVTHDQAMLYVRAMIAAAAADGRIDAKEQQKILGGLQQAGLDESAQQFLAKQVNNPASVDELAADVTSPQDALQVYTAARVAIDLDNGPEHAFLNRLAKALGIDDPLAAQVDAAARAAAA